MSNLLYIVAAILLAGWLFGFFVYLLGAQIHLLLILAILAVFVTLVKKEKGV